MTAATPAVLDRSAALERLGGDEDLLREIAGIFLDEYEQLMNELRLAAENGSASGLERAAHTFKGAVSNFGADAATEAAYRIEAFARGGEVEQARAAMPQLHAAMRPVVPALQLLARGA